MAKAQKKAGQKAATKPQVTTDQVVTDAQGKGQTPGTTQNTRITDVATVEDSETRAAAAGREPEMNGRDKHWTQESKERWDNGPFLADLLAESRANDEEARAAAEE